MSDDEEESGSVSEEKRVGGVEDGLIPIPMKVEAEGGDPVRTTVIA